ncbi:MULTISPECIES: prolipoprotein diacylglyceryl transferase family protein [unclassified Leptolyngbya]|uniref:prolipoprotein diacylglyceryl transferase family protein n=1 Tax=unclassified Leptolyngbya TaxID=2650499 RepID=UPI0016821E94|nr:prolipoprotein diacylglyceryl transferase [Leptolyngbya sp. FACHB-8]MBD2154216.1 prolipoprotein diacylglyceryl transferase [Leptolyngbya sp. FACHB-16]
MQFPVYLGFGSWKLHPHFVFESLGYAIALRLLLRNIKKDTISASDRSSVIVGGLLGALIGAKGLVLLQHINLLWEQWQQWLLLILQGKTVVGALLGAVAGVELTKIWIGVTRSTGDAFVYPLIAGTAIGRVGCFLTGLSDRTYGIATRLPWGVDFGDGIPRHPTQLYEIVFLVGLAGAIALRSRFPHYSGELFQLYLASYLSFRFFIDFLKPDFHPILGISFIQIACLLGLLYCLRQLSLQVSPR